MQGLIAFFTRYYFTVLFVFLQIIAFYFIVQNNHYQHSTFVNSSNAVSGFFYKNASSAKAYLDLKSENENLRAQMEILSNFSVDSLIPKHVLGQYAVERDKYITAVGKVINSTINYQNNHITLDIGSAQGVKTRMPVISALGVVGTVKDVSENYCTVVSLLYKNVVMNAKLKHNNYNAKVVWAESDYRYVQMVDLPNFVKVEAGDTVVTNSYSAIFPEGIMIGVVEETELVPGESLYTVKVKLSNDFRQLKYVMILIDKEIEERIELEEGSSDD